MHIGDGHLEHIGGKPQQATTSICDHQPPATLVIDLLDFVSEHAPAMN